MTEDVFMSFYFYGGHVCREKKLDNYIKNCHVLLVMTPEALFRLNKTHTHTDNVDNNENYRVFLETTDSQLGWAIFKILPQIEIELLNCFYCSS